ncbi:uncharacterized protein E0L32_001133 [Thyridium curvatum]|uniref:Uncharacterized protein n=1 Tax=Thyridium curvatum TaxID=1093900 RepID=A0A507AL58_9PEZI|nr:uncharacterized protein E0L32_001133 [Thyridium curvatum]TPX11315.1 hypothetical protein E0L32_001133 [Thyridium curvatum]
MSMSVSANVDVSAEVPVMTQMQTRMLKALRHPSYHELTLLFDELADELDANNTGPVVIPVNDMQNAVRIDQHCEMLKLLHQIPTDLCESIIRGTVAYDAKRGTNRPDAYSDDGPGTYVAGMSIDGRHGKFLSIAEISVLINDLTAYLDAYGIWQLPGGRWDPTIPGADRAADLIRAVDSQYGRPQADGSPRFVRNPAAAQKVRLLVENFRRRIDIGRDPTHNVWQTQSPLMVGCTSKTIGLRGREHDPAQGLGNTTYTWALTLCLIKRMGLVPSVTVRPVIRIWEREQLWRSKMLVTMLAQSLVTQQGFNVIQGGGLKTSHPTYMAHAKLVEARAYVCVRENYLRDNLAHTLDYIRNQQRFANCVQRLQGMLPPSLEATLDSAEITMVGLKIAVNEVVDAREQLHAEIARMEARLEELTAQRDHRRELYEVTLKVVNALTLDRLAHTPPPQLL